MVDWGHRYLPAGGDENRGENGGVVLESVGEAAGRPFSKAFSDGLVSPTDRGLAICSRIAISTGDGGGRQPDPRYGLLLKRRSRSHLGRGQWTADAAYLGERI